MAGVEVVEVVVSVNGERLPLDAHTLRYFARGDVEL